MLSKSFAFIKRDFSIQSSYKLSFVMGSFHTIIWLGIFYFVAKIFGKSASDYLIPYGGDYFAFVLIGLAFSNYFGWASGSFSVLIAEQNLGTLEAILLTPASIYNLILGINLWKFIFTTFNVLTYFLFAILFFGFSLPCPNFLSAFFVLVLALFIFAGISMMSTGFLLAFKRGNPFDLIFGGVSQLLGGVYFPIAVLPAWLKAISGLLPITHSLRALRLALLKGYSLKMLSAEFLYLIIFAIVFFSFGLIIFKAGLKKARKDGSLIHY